VRKSHRAPRVSTAEVPPPPRRSSRCSPLPGSDELGFSRFRGPRLGLHRRPRIRGLPAERPATPAPAPRARRALAHVEAPSLGPAHVEAPSQRPRPLGRAPLRGGLDTARGRRRTRGRPAPGRQRHTRNGTHHLTGTALRRGPLSASTPPRARAPARGPRHCKGASAHEGAACPGPPATHPQRDAPPHGHRSASRPPPSVHAPTGARPCEGASILQGGVGAPRARPQARRTTSTPRTQRTKSTP